MAIYSPKSIVTEEMERKINGEDVNSPLTHHTPSFSLCLLHEELLEVLFKKSSSLVSLVLFLFILHY